MEQVILKNSNYVVDPHLVDELVLKCTWTFAEQSFLKRNSYG